GPGASQAAGLSSTLQVRFDPWQQVSPPGAGVGWDRGETKRGAASTDSNSLAFSVRPFDQPPGRPEGGLRGAALQGFELGGAQRFGGGLAGVEVGQELRQRRRRRGGWELPEGGDHVAGSGMMEGAGEIGGPFPR